MKLKRVAMLTLLITWGGLVASAAAQSEALFDYRETVLDNGLRVITLEDFSAPIVAVQVWYHVGSKNENPARQGFAHMFEHMMFRGTDKLGPTDHFDLIRQTGGSTNAYTAFDQTVYVETLPANQLDLALWLEAERMTFLNIDQESFDTERKVVEEERRLGLNRPYGDVVEKVLDELFKTHPYRWSPIGNIAHLRASSVQELREFWQTYYVPNNATLVIAGAVSHDDALAKARKAFGWIPRYDDPPRVTVDEPEWDKRKLVEIEAGNAPTPIVGMVFRTVPQRSDDYAALQMLGIILGGGESSRVWKRLVIDEEAAVAALAVAFSLEQDGLFAAAAVLPPLGADKAGVMKTLREEVRKLRKNLVTEEELEKARNQMLTDTIASNATVANKATLLGQAAVLEGDTARVNERIAEIRAVTREDLQRVAQDYLKPMHSREMVVAQNVAGMFGGKGYEEEEAPITAEAETETPAPGRGELVRPDGWPTEPPIADLPEVDVALDFEEQTLDNGLRVVVVRNDELPIVTATMGFKAGAWTESDPGVTSLALQAIKHGTKTRDEESIASELETYGISLGGSGQMDVSTVSFSTLREHRDRAVELMADVIRNPTFPEKPFNRLKTQTVTGLAISQAEPSYLADREVRQILYGDHPYSRAVTGEVADVQAITPDNVRDWWSKFVRPADATLIFAGDIDLDEAVALAKRNFGDWQVETPMPSIDMPAPPHLGPTHIYLVDYPGGQAQIRVAQHGLTRHDPLYGVSRVVNGYFGGAFNARLNKKIRVDMGLTYGARGGFSPSRFAGDFEVSTFTKVDSTAQAVRAIFEELDRLATEPPSEEELNETKSNFLGSFPLGRETPQQVANTVWALTANGLPDDHLTELLNQVANTTPEQCVELVKNRIDPAKLAVVIVGPAAALKDELEAIAPVTVVKPGSTTTPGAPQ